MKITILLEKDGVVYDGTNCIVGDVVWENSIRAEAGKLLFSILRDGRIQFVEGSRVQFFVENVLVFVGWVMKKQRTSKQIITVTAYDQFFYLVQNKDTYVYYNKKASDLVQMIAGDYGLETGEICDTSFRIPQRIEEGVSLLDMIGTALDWTKEETGEEYFFYDKGGKLTISKKEDMVTDMILQCDGSLGEYTYTTDISEDTYTGVQLFQAGRLETERLAYQKENNEAVEQWGKLLYYQHVDHRLTQYDLQTIGAMVLAEKCRVKKTLCLETFLEDVLLRAGNSVWIHLPELAEISLQGSFVIEKCVYRFFNGGQKGSFWIRL